MEKVAAVEEAQQAAMAAMEAVVEYLASEPAPTSEAAHALIEQVLTEHDCESPEGHIVAGGAQSAEPHEQGSGVLLPHQPIVIDIYPRSKTSGYWGDMTRTVCIGEPPPELQRMYDTVLAGQELALGMVAPDVAGRDLHTAVAEHFVAAGYETSGEGKEFRFAEGFVHALGHGIDTEIHSTPVLSAHSDDVLAVGDIITIEPGLYYPHIGGVRLEDTIVVTEAGFDNLTQFPKNLRL
jgi:Xaa-Pro aminopeptidase